MTEVNKSQLAKELGVSAPMITKHIKAGILDKCFTRNGKKIYLEKAIEAIELSKKRDSNEKLVDVTAPKSDGDAIVNNESKEELKDLLSDAKSPSQKVQIIKDFWAGKTNRQTFLTKEKELIYVSDVKVAIGKFLNPLNQYMDDLPTNLKNHFPEISNEIIEWLSEQNNLQKEQLRKINWED